MITYNGHDYETRQITICPNDMAMTVTVAKRELWEAIKKFVELGYHPATSVDDLIMYYCDDAEWALTDSELALLLENL